MPILILSLAKLDVLATNTTQQANMRRKNERVIIIFIL
ncbi:hypothetical protein D051_1331 [Vibrio parahaemolyticus VPCR-2010]|nr:hypothetical protein D051_1331 [Vibrio parahaemolyticus VPCR-2010]